MRQSSYLHLYVGCIHGLMLVLCGMCLQTVALDFPGPAPGKAVANLNGGILRLENDIIAMTWRISDGSLHPQSIEDKISRKLLVLEKSECFELLLANTPLPGTRTLLASNLQITGTPEIGMVEANLQALRLADRQPGRIITVHFVSTDNDLAVIWKAELRDGSNYIRQSISCESKLKDLELREAVVWDLSAPGANVQGVVDGSPVTAGTLFFAAECPMSKNVITDQAGKSEPPKFRCAYEVNKLLQPSKPLQFHALVGVTPQGQIRRGFLYYLERERAQPYRQYLHYNNGTEIGTKYWALKSRGKSGEAEAYRLREQQEWLDAIETFGRELVVNRHVVLDGFVHDWGWDDENKVWQFHEGYPEGFRPAQQAAVKYNSRVGVWFSPFGGYPCREYRMKSGCKLGFETYRGDGGGLTLAGPRYFARFLAACQGMVDQYGVNYFKFDGFGAGNDKPGALDFASDVEALLDLIARLRSKKPDLFINASTGSWPSPFWLLHADSIWRQGTDAGTLGKGTPRQKWITYRDGLIFSGALERGPLVPVNSLMIHGLFINHLPFTTDHGKLDSEKIVYDEGELTAEIRSYFGTGVNLQEMYISPDLMTQRTWDVLAEAARWARRNAGVLVDTHPVGGKPLANEIYGWASWTPKKAILTLRNPDERPADFAFDPAKAFELPVGAAERYVLKSPWSEDASKQTVEVRAGLSHVFHMRPFEVLTFEATPLP